VSRLQRAFLLLFLVLLSLAAFWPVLKNDFIFYDDDVYVTKNEVVRRGLSWAGVRWAFTTGRAANWHPLTWLSHMADVSLFGMNPAGHHGMNLALHVLNTLLLFLVLKSLTGAVWRSALVAALFAVHPAHVESVAWAAERKDLLSTAFWLGTMWAYAAWVRKRTPGRYAAILLLFAAGLMSKPMLVSLPVVLLLLDFWPLERFGRGRIGGLVPEKVPLFALTAVSSVVTFLAQRAGGAVGSFEKYPFGVRLANAVVAYVRYLRILVWPADLAIFYPHPGTTLAAWEIGASALMLVGLSAAAILLRRQAPYLLVGWFWFVVTLVPVIGLVQVGWQAMADRYTYVPFIGLFIAVAWGAAAAVCRWKWGRVALRVATGLVLAALAVAARAQTRHWKNSEAVFLHAIRVTKDNLPAQNNLAHYYNQIGKPAQSLPHSSEAIRIRSDSSAAYINRGHSFSLQGRLDEAAEAFSQALRLDPRSSIAMNNLARMRFLQGEIPEAVRLYESTVALSPEWAEVRLRLAAALLIVGKTAAARAQLSRASALAPQDMESRQLLDDLRALDQDPMSPSAERLRQFLAAAHWDANVALQRRGKNAEAVAHLRQALVLSPAFAEAHNELGTLLTKEGRIDEAAAEFREAVLIKPGWALPHSNLGYALFLEGQTTAAIEQYKEALRLQPDLALAQNNLQRALLEQARQGKGRKIPATTARAR
jgi:tetratricopeptide (TPR) repeat protein